MRQRTVASRCAETTRSSLRSCAALADAPFPTPVLHDRSSRGARVGSTRRRSSLGSASVYCESSRSPLPRVAALGAGLRRCSRAVARRAARGARAARSRPGAASAAATRFDVEAMEGFGVLRACALAGVPAVELRAISNAPATSPIARRWRFAEALHRARASVAAAASRPSRRDTSRGVERRSRKRSNTRSRTGGVRLRRELAERDDVAEHVELYVNEFSIDLGPNGSRRRRRGRR